jgi:hypothetical protein
MKHLFADIGIEDALAALGSIDLVNPTKTLKSLARAMPKHTENLLMGRVAAKDLYATLSHTLRFVYLVRCNIFHGVKTHVEMARPEQQRRLMVYWALVISSNGLLFEIARRANIGWRDVDVDFSRIHAQPGPPADAAKATPLS